MSGETASSEAKSEAVAAQTGGAATAADVTSDTAAAQTSSEPTTVDPTNNASSVDTSSNAPVVHTSSDKASQAGGAEAKKGFFRLILRGIDAIVATAVILAMAAMTVVVSTQVFLRYGMNESLDWADEISRLLFVWSVFLAIPLGIGRGSHVAMELLTGRLGRGSRNALHRLMNLLAIGLMGVVGWQAGLLMLEQWDEPMSTLDVSVGLFMLPLAISSAHSVLHLLAGLVDGAPDTVATIIE